MRGLRLNLLTNTPYSLIIYAVQRKIYYTEEPPSCPVLFLFFSKLFLRGLFLRVNCKSNFTELNACEPRAGRFGKSGRAAGTVRARLPARPLISVSGREPCTENSEIGGPGAGTVRAQLPAKPLISVSGREPRTGNSEIGGPGAGTVRARLPAKPLISVPRREPRTGNSEIEGPGAGTVRARLLAKPLISVPRREPRTGNSEIGGPGAGRFAPRSPLGLIPSFRGANSSHNFRPESAISPAARSSGLLPVPR